MVQCRVINRTRIMRSSRGSGIPPAVFGAAVQVRSPLPLRRVLSADLASPSEAAHTANVEGGGLGARTRPRSSLATEKNETARDPLCRVIAQTCSAPLVGRRPAAARGLLLATEASFAAARSLDLLGRWAGAATSHARTARPAIHRQRSQCDGRGAPLFTSHERAVVVAVMVVCLHARGRTDRSAAATAASRETTESMPSARRATPPSSARGVASRRRRASRPITKLSRQRARISAPPRRPANKRRRPAVAVRSRSHPTRAHHRRRLDDASLARRRRG